MKASYSLTQLRVIGCLIEKSITTPDLYPLSLNALTNACNQKSNREPVMSLSESDVQNTLDQLEELGVVLKQFAPSSRVAKFQHRFCNTEFGDLNFSAQELGILCVLFLRGAQTPGELRSRTNRLCEFKNVAETENVLSDLMKDEQGPFVCKFEKEPGRRESRYFHCFSDQELNEENVSVSTSNLSVSSASDGPATETQLDSRVNELEDRVAQLEAELVRLSQKLSSQD